MMPGIGFTEMILLVIVSIIVIGPKDLPLMMRKFGQFTGKMKALAFEFQQGLDELGRQAELEELRKEVAELKKHTGLEGLQQDLEQDRADLEKDINATMLPAPVSPEAQAESDMLAQSASGEPGAVSALAVAEALPATEVEPYGGEPHYPLDASLEPPAEPPLEAPVAPSPVKQETPA